MNVMQTDCKITSSTYRYLVSLHGLVPHGTEVVIRQELNT